MIVGNMPKTLIAHELGHQWFGDSARFFTQSFENAFYSIPHYLLVNVNGIISGCLRDLPHILLICGLNTTWVKQQWHVTWSPSATLS